MGPDRSGVRVTVTDGRGRPIRDGGLGRWLASVVPARVRGDVAIALAPDAQVRALNHRYRRRNAPTDVLAFSVVASNIGFSHPEPRAANREPRFLGDIVIATGVARRQAHRIGHTYRTELRVLALHGLLHLLGYDHEDDGGRDRMARIEAHLRRKGGLKDGLIGRARRLRAAGPGGKRRGAAPARASTKK